MIKFLCTLLLLVGSVAFSQKNNDQLILVKKAQVPPQIDGFADDLCWEIAMWHPLDQLWLGLPYSKEDFSGRFKLSWTEDHLLLLVEIQDNVLYDQHADPLKLWWDDDCVEVFIDEDNSGGEHQYNHNAFAYHIALDYNTVDMDPEQQGRLYNNHVNTQKTTKGTTTIWEMAIRLYPDTYQENNQNNRAVQLFEGKKSGFALAYCDNDSSLERENFIGSVFVPGEDKNRGWIDANIFGTIELVD